MDAQRGIRKPREITVHGKERPYEDAVGDDGLLRYKWRGDDPDHAENRALRAAMEHGAPLIWFFGLAAGVDKPIFPVYLLLGIRPDLVVEIRADLLEEVDGPMLEHGLTGRHGQQLMAVPTVRAERPDSDSWSSVTPCSGRRADGHDAPSHSSWFSGVDGGRRGNCQGGGRHAVRAG